MIGFILAVTLSMVNPTYSPDSTMIAFTRDNDLWVQKVADGTQTRITTDGSGTVLNGYASWVYYEEILGRASNYRAFWWSPDSRKIGFYRFDETDVPVFPIFSPFGQNGGLRQTRYPKAGQNNPSVRIGMADVESNSIVWADFDENEDQYFGIPFWDSGSRYFYIAREPRRQNTLDLYAVDSGTGKKRAVYHEEYPTWLNWIEEVIFTEKGLYMARSFETGWEQIYFLSYDGKTFKRLTDGPNWAVSLLKVDEKKGDVWFSAKRDSKLHPAVYRADRKGRISCLTDTDFYADQIKLDPDGKHFTARLSTASQNPRIIRGNLYGYEEELVSVANGDVPLRPRPEILKIENDGYELYGLISYPEGFDPGKKYPVLMQLYGGPGTPYVRDRWKDRDASDDWCFHNGIIYMVVDPRSSGENGRRGMDEAFRRMTVPELGDYIAWAEYMQAQPYVKADRIGVEGFSFGGTTTSMLVLRYPEYFCCGVAGGGVYDWTLYDSHYTERFMDTPQANPEGYAEAGVLNYVKGRRPGRLKLTHGTGDDNVHYQNTLLLMDALQNEGIQFDLMLYPDGMHGYRGAQHEHDRASDHLFWSRYLLDIRD